MTLSTAQQHDVLKVLVAASFQSNNPGIIGRTVSDAYATNVDMGLMTEAVADGHVEYAQQFLGEMFAALVEADMEATAS